MDGEGGTGTWSWDTENVHRGKRAYRIQRESNAGYSYLATGPLPVEAGKSYELWIVSDKLQRPRSLGVIGGNDFTARPVLSAYEPELVNQATYAVTVEPEGGSPTGVPTGPIVFTGKLIETVPPAPSATKSR